MSADVFLVFLDIVTVLRVEIAATISLSGAGFPVSRNIDGCAVKIGNKVS